MTTATVFHLLAITDESISKIHLGAKEKANRTWCGVDLLVKDDPRFGGRYKGIVYSSSTELATVTCGACKRSAAWKGQKGGKYVVPAAKPEARTSIAPNGAMASAKDAAEVVSGSAVVEADPETGLPRIKPEIQARADAIVADQAARNAGKTSR